MRTLTLVLAFCFACGGQTPAYARPHESRITNHQSRPALKDWRWWIGEGIILGAVAADAASSCRFPAHGYREANPILGPHPSCRDTSLLLTGAAGFYTGLHLLNHWIGRNEDYGPNQWLRYGSVPLAVAAVHGTAAVHNYMLPVPNPAMSAPPSFAAPGN